MIFVVVLYISIPVIHLIEGAPFLSLILKTSAGKFRSIMGASLIRDFSGKYYIYY